jgi:hypothetical protein
MSQWEWDAYKGTKGVFSKGENGYVYGPLQLQGEPDCPEIEAFIENNVNIHYWVLKAYNMRRILRDKQFIDEKLKELQEVWEKIVFYRNNREAFKKEILMEVHIETEPVTLKPYAFIE